MTDNHSLNILLVTSDHELVDWFREDVGGIPGENGEFVMLISGGEHRVRALTEPASSGNPPPENADLLVGLVRHVDLFSLRDMRLLLKSIPPDWNLPTGIMIYRNENEVDFKMSCPHCGQKIWVRDADVDKRGRCPNCKKGFTLPTQDDHVCVNLGLNNGEPVHRLERGNPASISGPMRVLMRARDALTGSV